MKRPYILVIVGVVLIIAAIALNYMLTKSADEETAPAVTQAPAVTTETTPNEPASEPATDAPAITNPSFDVVRIGPDGNAVIAGRAEPNSTVRIREGEEVIGEATADERGEWVVLPNKPLAGGDRELSLEAEDATGNVSKADDKVVVLIPEEKAPAATNEQSGETGETTGTTGATDSEPESEKQPVIALKVPSDGDGAVTVMQGPAPEAAAKQEEGSDTQDATLPRLSIDVVDYDTEGRVAMSGKADLNHTVRVYLDNNHVGTAPADENGNWALTIGQPIEPGNYTLRADQLDSAGKVTARVEIPFERARPDQILEPGSRYVVQPGNSLWRIARSTYGEGLKYWVIYHQNRNQIRDPDLIYPGQIFALPNEENQQ
ncbi:MAG: LysM peptidoglycan-binding domain-containing protein [Thalassospira sp.]|uniref:Ig-like domain-containing protein n=3 Tax=Thalassospira sp. TaxID=1912094 RepID=UPI001B0690D3|nr:Ig-like domain-containing protein [Thalassospira sp.]MBO6819839.1 LysM peptidoglycan-binding domain-containing protein [Thalassospira sp.]MBO6886465.1 LysM peptidoglycan-binding domain-containing protein [Thalassospira sp.]